MSMRRTQSALVLAATVFFASQCCFALDQVGLSSEFSLPDRSRNLVDSQDEYYNAVLQLQTEDAAVVRAREAAMKDAQCAPDYVAAVKAVDVAFQTFCEKKNALVADLEKNNPVYAQMKSQATAIDAKIDAARQNPDTTPEQFEELYKNRETFQKQWHQMEADAMDRAGLTPLRQQWVDASKKLSDLQEKSRVSVESNEKLKAALANQEEAKAAVQQARAAIQTGNTPGATAGSEQAGAGDFLRKYSRTGFAGNDAWWTYGWSTINAGVKPVTPVPGK